MVSEKTSKSWPPGVELRSSSNSPLGAIKLHGYLPDSRGQGQGTRRRLGRYALVYSLRGQCKYWDEINGHRVVGPGEAFFLFPEIAHRYGGSEPGGWSELFLVFEGPVFDFWRKRGLLDQHRAFLKLEPVAVWRKRIEHCVVGRGIVDQADAIRQVIALQSLIADALEAQEFHKNSQPAWIDAACTALSEPGALQIRLPGLALSLGVSFETFRKRFTALMGVSPGAWRAARLVDAAALLLADPSLGGKEIAVRLGFSDEFHFSRRFHDLSGMTPTEFRRRMGPVRSDPDSTH